MHPSGSQLPALTAQRLICKGSLDLRYRFRAIGKVDLLGATIYGNLNCDCGRFLGKGVALNFDAITIVADVFLRDGFEAQGTINLIRAQIARNLELTGASLTKSFIAQGMRVGAWFYGSLQRQVGSGSI